MDLDNIEGNEDANIRIETNEAFATVICVDRFKSDTKDANEAHIGSEFFLYSNAGAEEATQFLQRHGFRAAVAIK